MGRLHTKGPHQTGVVAYLAVYRNQANSLQESRYKQFRVMHVQAV